MSDLIEEARRAQKAVYLATEKDVADDLSRIIGGLAAALARAEQFWHDSAAECRAVQERLDARSAALARVTDDSMVDRLVPIAPYGRTPQQFACAVLAAIRAAAEGQDEQEPDEPCSAEMHSWDYFKHGQVDSYWMRCHEFGAHDKHRNSETGATWQDEQGGERR